MQNLTLFIVKPIITLKFACTENSEYTAVEIQTMDPKREGEEKKILGA